MYGRIGFLFAITFLLVACQTNSVTQAELEKVSPDKLLSASQLKALLTGKKMSYYNRNGVLEEDHLKDDGSIKSEDMEGAKDTGRWWVEEPNTLCRQWSQWADGNKVCSQVAKDGDTYYAVRLGVKASRGFEIVN